MPKSQIKLQSEIRGVVKKPLFGNEYIEKKRRGEIASNRLAVDGESFQQAGSDTIYLPSRVRLNFYETFYVYDIVICFFAILYKVNELEKQVKMEVGNARNNEIKIAKQLFTRENCLKKFAILKDHRMLSNGKCDLVINYNLKLDFL